MKPYIHYSLSTVRRAFNRAASHYDTHALVQHEIGARLLNRINCLKSLPKTIVDIGCGTGKHTHALHQHFHQSTVIGVDLAFGMIRHALQKPLSHSYSASYLCANMQTLPFIDQSIDLIFSNFTLQWADDLLGVFKEFKRVLSPQGMLFFTTLGPDTLNELRASYNMSDNTAHIHPFYDMHDIGDLLLKSGFQDPVVDKESLIIQYQTVSSLLRDLKGVGSSNLSTEKSTGCMTLKRLQEMQRAYEKFKDPQGYYPATYEVIYGHALNPSRAFDKKNDVYDLKFILPAAE